MSDQLTKLRPDRDLQCYFQRPTAVAAMSGASEAGFTVSGSFRQQFDWAVVEWNRENVFEYPSLRNLPDGDLRGVRLSYKEVRSGCIPMDSSLYPTVEWPYLRIWAADLQGGEYLYDVPLKKYASAADGGYTAATATFTLQGTPAGQDYIELAWMDQHINYRLKSDDSLESAVSALAANINQYGDGSVTATAAGAQITLAYSADVGANANRIGVYGTVFGAATESWSPASAYFSGGAGPRQWQIDLDFSSLEGYIDPDRITLVSVPTAAVRKMRWTWAASLQRESFQREAFQVTVTDWQVAGSNLSYQVAGPGSRRIEDNAPEIAYSGTWVEGRGNFSGGSIHYTSGANASFTCTYSAATAHSLYLGTRKAAACGPVEVRVDGVAKTFTLTLDEDVLVRMSLGQFGPGSHTVTVTHKGSALQYTYFDFLELAIPTVSLPTYSAMPSITLATDWDTDHSIALPPERTAWLLDRLGFQGRSNHYVGALWFYELCNPSMRYSSATVTFSGHPEFGKKTELHMGSTVLEHYNLIGETPESLATCLALLVNNGSTGVWASASGAVLTITSRQVGKAGDGLPISCVVNNSGANQNPLSAVSSGSLSAGDDGKWLTDLTAEPPINPAARDWARAYFEALTGYGIESTAAFSMELQHGDDSVAAGIAQRYPNGDPCWLTTPALQTNFGPESTAYWKKVFADMAQVMVDAGVTPYLQFGETQWWYFPGQTATVATEPGMPLYDAYTKSRFQSQYGHAMAVIPNQYAAAAAFPQECAFLPGLIGEFTATVRNYVRQSFPTVRFEVLYPPDVNDTELNKLINFPASDWTPANLDCLKTENFTFTFERNLNKAAESIHLPSQYGFPSSKSSHLVGISEYTTPWQKEQRLALGARMESVVLFALDQFCLIGYALPFAPSARTARYQGRMEGPATIGSLVAKNTHGV